MTTPKTRREQEFEAFKKAWEEYPSQDNEGFVPDRGGFKCGWFAALRWSDSTPAPSEQGDEEWIDSRVMELMGDGYNTESQGVERAVRKVMLREGIAHARRTQAERMIRLQSANDGLKKVVSHYFAEIERLKRENAELKDIRDADTIQRNVRGS